MIIYCYDEDNNLIENTEFKTVDLEYTIPLEYMYPEDTYKIVLKYESRNTFNHFNRLTFLMEKGEKNVNYKNMIIELDYRKFTHIKSILKFPIGFDMNLLFQNNFYLNKIVNTLAKKYDITKLIYNNKIFNLLKKTMSDIFYDEDDLVYNMIRYVSSQDITVDESIRILNFISNFKLITKRINDIKNKALIMSNPPIDLITFNIVFSLGTSTVIEPNIYLEMVKNVFTNCMSNKHVKTEYISSTLKKSLKHEEMINIHSLVYSAAVTIRNKFIKNIFTLLDDEQYEKIKNDKRLKRILVEIGI